MRKATMLVTVFLATLLLALPAVASSQRQSEHSSFAKQQFRKTFEQQHPDSEGRKLHKAYFQKREAMKQKRDEALKVRTRNVSGNNPGDTGL